MRMLEPRTGLANGPDANPRGPLMTPDAALLSPENPKDSREIGPLFIHAELNAPTDLGDWWLDLGHPGDLNLPA